MGRVIFQTDNKVYRIVECLDTNYDIDELKGDMYKPELHPDISKERIELEEKQFENLVSTYGVYGYVLEKWNPEPGVGYEHINSCWGFVGQYEPDDEKFNHYIVDELKSIIQEQTT